MVSQNSVIPELSKEEQWPLKLFYNNFVLLQNCFSINKAGSKATSRDVIQASLLTLYKSVTGADSYNDSSHSCHWV